MGKYGNIKTEVRGVLFDSKAEARRYEQLLLRLRVGDIHSLELHPRFDLAINGIKLGFYKADFAYFDARSSQRIVEDVKGVRTPIFNLKAKLVRALHGVSIAVIA